MNSEWRGEKEALTPGPSPSQERAGRGEEEALTPGPSPSQERAGRGEKERRVTSGGWGRWFDLVVQVWYLVRYYGVFLLASSLNVHGSCITETTGTYKSCDADIIGRILTCFNTFPISGVEFIRCSRYPLTLNSIVALFAPGFSGGDSTEVG